MRRAVVKKKQKRSCATRNFVEGCIKHGVLEKEKAEEIFAAIEYFQTTASTKRTPHPNRLTCQTAYLKAHTPRSTCRNAQCGVNNSERLVLYRGMPPLGIKVLPQTSTAGTGFHHRAARSRPPREPVPTPPKPVAQSVHSLRPGCVKNIVEGPIETILQARNRLVLS